jgi:hypothetical protein
MAVLMTAIVTEHAVCALPADHRDWRHLVIRVQRRGSTEHWRVMHGSFYLTDCGEWSPNVEDAMVLSEESALDFAHAQAPLVDVNGLTAADLINR